MENCKYRSCGKPLENKRKHYCDSTCQYRERTLVKEEKNPSRGWGNKNSQIRLDKAISRYSKRLSRGNCARYY